MSAAATLQRTSTRPNTFTPRNIPSSNHSSRVKTGAGVMLMKRCLMSCDLLSSPGGGSCMRQRVSARSIYLAILLAALVQPGTASQKQPQRVRFEPGKSSATTHGHIAGFDAQDYVVDARAGQQMDIRLKASNSSTYFVLYSINGKTTDMNETDHYSLETTESGDYVIRVFMMRAAARRKGAASNYTLTISIR